MNESQTPSFFKKLGVSPGAKRLARLRPDPTLLLLLALCLPLLGPLFAPGYIYDTHDGRHSVFYLIQFDASLRDGAWWPRWAMHHIQGYGYPTFLIQAPLGLYLGEIFVLLGAGFTLAAKLSWAVGVLAGAWGMYALVKFWLRVPCSVSSVDSARLAEATRNTQHAPRTTHQPFDPVPLAALVAAVLYTYFPYHIADLYVRGALNDSLLLGWLPWVFLVFDRLLLGGATQGWPRRLGVAMLVLAGTLLTHTFALLSIAPLLVTFVLFRLAQGWRRDGLPWRPALLAAAGGVGALLLCSIFLLPLFAEGRFLQQQVYVTDTYDFRNHFVQFGQYFSPFWGFGFSDDPLGANDGMSFALGPLLIILGIGALFVVGQARRARAEMIYLLAAGLALLLVMTPLAQPLWEALPPLAVIQFPWRLLALAGFVFSALGGLVAWNLADRTSQPAEMVSARSLLWGSALARGQRLAGTGIVRNLCQLALPAGQALARGAVAGGRARRVPLRAGAPGHDRLHPVGEPALHDHRHDRRLCCAGLCRSARQDDEPDPLRGAGRRRPGARPGKPRLQRNGHREHDSTGHGEDQLLLFSRLGGDRGWAARRRGPCRANGRSGRRRARRRAPHRSPLRRHPTAHPGRPPLRADPGARPHPDFLRAFAPSCEKNPMTLILAIETSCDETAAAVVADDARVLSNVVATQIELHRRFGGVFPEVASRQHVLAIQPVITQALTDAGLSHPNQVDAIAVTHGPGLVGSLLVGVNAAKGLAFATGKPLLPINHLEGHIYSNWAMLPTATRSPRQLTGFLSWS